MFASTGSPQAMMGARPWSTTWQKTTGRQEHVAEGGRVPCRWHYLHRWLRGGGRKYMFCWGSVTSEGTREALESSEVLIAPKGEWLGGVLVVNPCAFHGAQRMSRSRHGLRGSRGPWGPSRVLWRPLVSAAFGVWIRRQAFQGFSRLWLSLQGTGDGHAGPTLSGPGGVAPSSTRCPPSGVAGRDPEAGEPQGWF